MVFNDRKAAQIAAFFLKASGGSINHMKLIKLMYLADRQALQNHGFPISRDRFVSMDHGPVLSQTLNLINGEMQSSDNGWKQWIGPRQGNSVKLLHEVTDRGSYDELSDIDLEILASVWKSFGHMDRFDLVQYCHDNCAEWEDPEGSSTPIPYARTLKAVGKTAADAEELASLIEGQNGLSRILARH